MTPEISLPPRSPSARFIAREGITASAPSSRDYWIELGLQVASNPRGLSGILQGINALSLSDDDDEYKPRAYAIKNAKDRIKYGYAVLDDAVRSRLPIPTIMADGTGGIVIVWNLNGRTLNAGFPPDPSTRRGDYLYYQSGNEYRLIKGTLTNLKSRLEWLAGE